jgi:hypothetical protein
MKPAGRPREFTPELQSEFLDLIAQGLTVAQAAWGVGVSLRTVQREMKGNDEFHHELELAQEAAPANPEQLMRDAARAHWRAAAWMLERADPDRYGKRPASSCSPEKLQAIVNHLIERALEATAPEQRQAVYQHLRPVADQALAAFQPVPQETKRWLQNLAMRPTPLSTACLPDGPRSSQEAAGRDVDRASTPPAASANLPASEVHPPDGGIMSPKMHVAPEGDVLQPTVHEIATNAPAPLAEIVLPQRARVRNAKSLHIQTRDEARRERRKAARARRKGRDAA